MSDDVNIAKIRNTLDFLDVKITALNRGFIMFLNVLQNKGILSDNEISWIDRIKRDVVLAKAIENEKLMERVLDLSAKVNCPESSEAATNLARNHIIKYKARSLPKL